MQGSLVEGELSPGVSASWRQGLPFFLIHMKVLLSQTQSHLILKPIIFLIGHVPSPRARFTPEKHRTPGSTRPGKTVPKQEPCPFQPLTFRASPSLLEWQQFSFPCIHSLGDGTLKLCTSRRGIRSPPFHRGGRPDPLWPAGYCRSDGEPVRSLGCESPCLSAWSPGIFPTGK